MDDSIAENVEPLQILGGSKYLIIMLMFSLGNKKVQSFNKITF